MEERDARDREPAGNSESDETLSNDADQSVKVQDSQLSNDFVDGDRDDIEMSEIIK